MCEGQSDVGTGGLSKWMWAAFTLCGAALLLAAFIVPSVALGVAGTAASLSGLWVLYSRAHRMEPRPTALSAQEPAGQSAVATAAAAQVVAVTPRIPPSLELGVVLAALRDSVAGVAPAVSAHLWLADDATGTLRQVAAVGPMAPSNHPTQLGADDVLAETYASGRAQMAPLALLQGLGEATTMWRYALPVSAGDALGVAAVDFQSVSEPDTGALPALTAPLRGSLAGALGVYVSHIELTTAQMLIKSTRDLSRMLDPREVLEASLARAMELSEAQTGSVMLVDSNTGRLQIALSKGLPEKVVESTSLSEGEGIAGWVFASRQPLLVEDMATGNPSARRHGVRSAVSVPIADEDGVLGVLNVGSRSFPARFTESHMRSMELLGKQTAIALRNARAVVESRALYFDTLKALAIALETKDPYSRGGTERVLEYAEAIGHSFGLPDNERDALHIAALLHDIGMAAAGEGVAVADRPLTTVERALLRMHPQIAAEILDEAPALRHVVPIVYHHHEWYDGEGYLNGASGEGIPLGARILAVADAYVAMTSDRPYRRAFSEREALQELTEKAGTQFDPAVVDALRDVLQGGPNRVPGSSGGSA